jgi:hypothetical protein
MSSRSTEFAGSAMAILEADHRTLLRRIESVLNSRNSLERQQEWRAFSEAIKRHMAVEAEILYPAFLDATKDSLTYFVASVGHDSIAAELREVLEEPASAKFVARMRSLQKVLVHHISDMEAKGGLFDLARQSTLNQERLAHLVRSRYTAPERTG